jgi:hypothetical protein
MPCWLGSAAIKRCAMACSRGSAVQKNTLCKVSQTQPISTWYSRPRLQQIVFSFPSRFPMLYHSNYLSYTGLSYIGSSAASDFSDIPQQLIFLSYTVFGKIMDSSQRLQCVRAQRAHLSERHEVCVCNLTAFCTRRHRGDL